MLVFSSNWLMDDMLCMLIEEIYICRNGCTRLVMKVFQLCKTLTVACAQTKCNERLFMNKLFVNRVNTARLAIVATSKFPM